MQINAVGAPQFKWGIQVPFWGSFKQENSSIKLREPVFGSLSQARFDEIFPIFLAHTDEKLQMVDNLGDHFRQLQQNKWLRHRQTINITDLGCGNGTTSGMVLEKLRESFPNPKFIVSGIDNNAQQLTDYKKHLTTSLRAQVSTHQANIFDTALRPKRTDIVLASHSFYHASPENIQQSIRTVCEALRPSGLAIISMLKDDSDFARIQAQFGPYVTTADEKNPVTTNVFDLQRAINREPLAKNRLKMTSYNAYVYFPQIPDGGFKSFMRWQLHQPDQPAPNPESKTTLDLLEFILHGEFAQLREQNQLKNFLENIDGILRMHGPTDEGHQRFNFNGVNLIIEGVDNPLRKA